MSSVNLIMTMYRGLVPEGLNQRVPMTLKRGLCRALNVGAARQAALMALGETHEKNGDLYDAIAAYEQGLRQLDDATDAAAVFRLRQNLQFRLERAYHQLGRPRVTDPLFECEIMSGGRVEPREEKVAAGFFEASLNYLGLRFEGFLKRNDFDGVKIFLNGRFLRTVGVDRHGTPPRFRFRVKRSTLALFPPQAEFSVRTEDGAPLLFDGLECMSAMIPHGTDGIDDVLQYGGRVDKKGYIAPSEQEIAARQHRYLEIYESVRRFFDREIGRPLFLMYGTLLGFHREGSVIPGDDDFDVGYFSEQTKPVAVKREAKEIAHQLVRAGFVVSINRQGRLFRVRESKDGPDCHLDVRPIWFQSGRIWAHNHACLPCAPKDFLPVREGMLQDTDVYAPRNPQAFLESYYGPEWKVPDPSYTNASARIPLGVRRNLAKACITPGEFREMDRQLRDEWKQIQGGGRLISIGLHDLYPLEKFEADCGW